MSRKSTKPDRRQDVLSAAGKLFMANGYMSTTMDDIADAVSLNKGTLYYYYDSKASILYDIVYDIEEGRLQIARNQPKDEDPGTAVRRYVIDSIIYIVDHPTSSRISMQESPFLDMWLSKEQMAAIRRCHDELQAHFLRLIEEGIKRKIFADVDPRVLMETITGVLIWLPRWFRQKGRLSKQQVAEQIADVVMNGVQLRSEGSALKPEPVVGNKTRASISEAPVAAPAKPAVPDGRAQRRRARAAAVSKQIIDS